MNRLFGLVVCAILWIIPAAVVFGLPPMPITQCETLSQPGTYALQQDIKVPVTVEKHAFVYQCIPAECLSVTAPGVSLDLNGHMISPIYGPPYLCPIGVHVAAGADNASIHNGRLSGFQNAILIEGNGISVDRVTTSPGGNIDGGNVFLNHANNGVFTNLSITGAGTVEGPPFGFFPRSLLIISESTHNLFGKLALSGSSGFDSLNVVLIEGGGDNVFYKGTVESAAHGGAVLALAGAGNAVIDTTATK
jgi:hypothetical protein